nr:MAG TPA: hypothetical protein [Caudoviricetes sp.]DAX55385.1 MAG TPA: hypothetical protein [Caudoviricetes sp.]
MTRQMSSRIASAWHSTLVGLSWSTRGYVVFILNIGVLYVSR